MTLLEQIPGLSEAITAERHVRETAFLDLPDRIGPFEVQPLTLRTMQFLGCIGSPFVNGGNVTPADVAIFLLVLSGQPTGIKRWWLLRRIGLCDAASLLKWIEDYLLETNQDAPPSEGESNHDPVYVGVSATIVDLLAVEYGWSEDAVLDLPLKRLFQYVKIIGHRRDPERPRFNPSDAVRSKWVAEVNKRN